MHAQHQNCITNGSTKLFEEIIIKKIKAYFLVLFKNITEFHPDFTKIGIESERVRILIVNYIKMESKKNSKADLNRKQSLFLQIGLILVLLIAYFGLEWKSYEKQDFIKDQISLGEISDEPIPITTLPIKTPPVIPAAPDVIDVIPDDKKTEEDPIATTEDKPDEIVDIKEITEAKPVDPIGPVPFDVIEDVPIFPGCENLDSNSERKTCMSEKINQFIKQNFDTELGSRLGLTGINKVIIMFKINTAGDIVEVQSRGPHPKLEKEAERVINSLPKMQPGKQRGKPVPVSFSLPIIFKVDN